MGLLAGNRPHGGQMAVRRLDRVTRFWKPVTAAFRPRRRLPLDPGHRGVRWDHMATQDDAPNSGPASRSAPDFPFDEATRSTVRRHERVLHTRISEELAGDSVTLRTTCGCRSRTWCANVLEEAFGAVERVSDEVGDFLEDVLGDAGGRAPGHPPPAPARPPLARRRAPPLPARRRGPLLARREPGRGRLRRGGGGRRCGAARRCRRARRDRGARAHRGARGSRARRSAGAARPPLPPRALRRSARLAAAAAECRGALRRRDRPLAAGERVFVGATERGLSRTFLCDTCMRARGGV